MLDTTFAIRDDSGSPAELRQHRLSKLYTIRIDRWYLTCSIPSTGIPDFIIISIASCEPEWKHIRCHECYKIEASLEHKLSQYKWCLWPWKTSTYMCRRRTLDVFGSNPKIFQWKWERRIRKENKLKTKFVTIQIFKHMNYVFIFICLMAGDGYIMNNWATNQLPPRNTYEPTHVRLYSHRNSFKKIKFFPPKSTYNRIN